MLDLRRKCALHLKNIPQLTDFLVCSVLAATPASAAKSPFTAPRSQAATPARSPYLPVKTEDVEEEAVPPSTRRVSSGASKEVAKVDEEEDANQQGGCNWCSCLTSVCNAPFAYYIVVALVLAAWCVILYGDGAVAAMSAGGAVGVSGFRRAVKAVFGCCAGGHHHEHGDHHGHHDHNVDLVPAAELQ